MTIENLKDIYEKNESSKGNTYVVPIFSTGGFIRDELMIVRSVGEASCVIFRCLDGSLLDLDNIQLRNFKCVGSCGIQ